MLTGNLSLSYHLKDIELINKNIDILMIAPAAGKSGGGGVATYVNSLIQKLPNEIKVKRIVTVKDTDILSRIFTYITSLFTIFKEVIFDRKQKVAHIHMASGGSFLRKALIVRLLKFFNLPVILHLHGGRFHLFYKEQSEKKRKCIRETFLMADKVIVLTHNWKEWYINTIEQKAPLVVYNGVEDFMTSKVQLSMRKNHILFLGRLGEEKGTYDLLKAFEQVHNRYNDAKLILAGDGDIEECKVFADFLKIGESVECLGWIGYEEKKNLLNSCKVFCLPSYNEGFPISVLEAMSAGLGIVSTNVGGIPEAIENGKSGLLVEAGDIDGLVLSLNRILGDDKICDKFSMNARKRYVENFTLSEKATEIKKIYTELVNSN